MAPTNWIYWNRDSLDILGHHVVFQWDSFVIMKNQRHLGDSLWIFFRNSSEFVFFSKRFWSKVPLVYFWGYHHIFRNYISESWIRTWGSRFSVAKEIFLCACGIGMVWCPIYYLFCPRVCPISQPHPSSVASRQRRLFCHQWYSLHHPF